MYNRPGCTVERLGYTRDWTIDYGDLSMFSQDNASRVGPERGTMGRAVFKRVMERGLIWLPLLVLFFGLAWAGWNEFRKVDAYQGWAKGFDRAKYDILSVLGQRGDRLVWG
ncbi:hypothetical protein E1H12_08395, partial [Geitlerinema sp. P-1104]|nr:hypothetical protein [Geitlerinema sp. P-1104]